MLTSEVDINSKGKTNKRKVHFSSSPKNSCCQLADGTPLMLIEFSGSPEGRSGPYFYWCSLKHISYINYLRICNSEKILLLPLGFFIREVLTSKDLSGVKEL